MTKLYCILTGCLFSLMLLGVANARDFAPDEVAENQGAVAYWYAHAYANAFGGFAATWADIDAKGVVLREFNSPHTGQAINFDDGSLDFDGDMMYVAGDWDVEVHVQTTAGVIVLPGFLTGADECGVSSCCDITICGYECWNLCDEEAVCKILQWIMWPSFETFECRYFSRPCGEEEWFASGFAPIDATWREKAPEFLDIEYVWKKGDPCYCDCILKKAYVHCNICEPCPDPCKPKCEDPCKPKCKPKCDDPCKPKCKMNTCTPDPCKPKCDEPCKPKCKPKCEDPCKPKCKPKCDDPCKPKCKMNTCTPDPCKPKCEPKCKPKCEEPCKPKCEPKCKPKCDDPCKPKCKVDTCKTDPCKPKCDPCK